MQRNAFVEDCPQTLCGLFKRLTHRLKRRYFPESSALNRPGGPKAGDRSTFQHFNAGYDRSRLHNKAYGQIINQTSLVDLSWDKSRSKERTYLRSKHQWTPRAI